LAMRDSSAKTTTLGLTAILRVPGHPGAVVAGTDALWTALSRDSQDPAGDPRLLRLDLATRSPAPPVYIGGEVSHLTRAADHLIASVQHVSGLGQLAILDWRSGAVLVRHWYERPVDQTVIRGSDLWALEVRPGRLLRLDSRTLERAAAPVPLAPGRTLGLASGAGYLWATAADEGDVLRIDPTTHELGRAHVGGFPLGIVVTGGSVWFADREGGKVVRLDPRSLRQVGSPIPVGGKPSWLVAAGRSLFVTDEDDGTVSRIDVQSGKRTGLPIRITPPVRGGTALSVAPAGQSIWVSSSASSTLNRIDSAAGRDNKLGKITVRITRVNDKQQGDRITNGQRAGAGDFVISGAVSETGRVVVYRTVKPSLITLRFVTSGGKGAITFLVKIDLNFGTSRWTIASGRRAYKDLHGEGAEHENANNTVITLTGTVSR
jgi:hypothetical protein